MLPKTTSIQICDTSRHRIGTLKACDGGKACGDKPSSVPRLPWRRPRNQCRFKSTQFSERRPQEWAGPDFWRAPEHTATPAALNLQIALSVSNDVVKDANIMALAPWANHDGRFRFSDNLSPKARAGMRIQESTEAPYLLIPSFIDYSPGMIEDLRDAIEVATWNVREALESATELGKNLGYLRWLGASDQGRRQHIVQNCYKSISPGGATSFDAWTHELRPSTPRITPQPRITLRRLNFIHSGTLASVSGS
ncbi:hypothetical protein C8Q78DRAFT_1141463 [Trametes maxima]|nr:hypothetical protein C8Q78DRAFT_1141463 [Trametes maxima]